MNVSSTKLTHRPSLRRAIGAGLLVVCGLLLYEGRSEPAAASPAHAAARPASATVVDGTAPRRILPTRTQADPSPPPDAPMVCPLQLIDRETGETLDALPEWAPDHTQLRMDPPVLPALTVDLDDHTARIPAAEATRLSQLPWADGLISGRIPGLGETALRLDDKTCSRMMVLLESPEPLVGVSCPVSEDVDLTDGHRLILADGPFEGVQLDARTQGDQLVLLDAPDTGEAWLRTRSLPPILVSWEADRCDPIALPELASLAIEVEGPSFEGPVWVKGCGVTRRLDDRQRSIELEVSAVPCALEAWRLDGALRALSPLVTVDPLPGSTTMARLMLPETETGGMGIAFRTGEEAVSVHRVRPDSPAWEAGLRAGDRILFVDGEPTAGLQQHDFIALGTGPVGSEVLLTVEAEDGTVDELFIERAALPR